MTWSMHHPLMKIQPGLDIIQKDGTNTCRMATPAAAKAADVFTQAFKTCSLVTGVTVVSEAFLLTSSFTDCPSLSEGDIPMESLASGISVRSFNIFSEKMQGTQTLITCQAPVPVHRLK